MYRRTTGFFHSRNLPSLPSLVLTPCSQYTSTGQDKRKEERKWFRPRGYSIPHPNIKFRTHHWIRAGGVRTELGPRIGATETKYLPDISYRLSPQTPHGQVLYRRTKLILSHSIRHQCTQIVMGPCHPMELRQHQQANIGHPPRESDLCRV